MAPCLQVIAHMDLDISPSLHIIADTDMDMTSCLHIITHMDMDMAPCPHICYLNLLSLTSRHGSGYGSMFA